MSGFQSKHYCHAFSGWAFIDRMKFSTWTAMTQALRFELSFCTTGISRADYPAGMLYLTLDFYVLSCKEKSPLLPRRHRCVAVAYAQNQAGDWLVATHQCSDGCRLLTRSTSSSSTLSPNSLTFKHACNHMLWTFQRVIAAKVSTPSAQTRERLTLRSTKRYHNTPLQSALALFRCFVFRAHTTNTFPPNDFVRKQSSFLP